MFRRIFLLAILIWSAGNLRAQEAFAPDISAARDANGNRLVNLNAWLDLRQTSNSKPQDAPPWIDAITLVPVAARNGQPASTVFRIRVSHPREDMQLLLLRLFFDDKAAQRPTITAWDESGTHVMQSGVLGAGLEIPTSDSVLLPMIGVSCIDIEVAGDGKSVRGVYLDWMTSRRVVQPTTVEAQKISPEPFAATAPLPMLQQDHEKFGAVTALLSPDTIRIGASVQDGAAFQFALEAVPLVALISFEVANARADAPPEIFLNGESLGTATLLLPDLADPGYRGEATRMIDQMRFNYTGWMRAQKLVPAAMLRSGTNDLLIVSGAGVPVAAIRATQIQLKYLWDKSDYVLEPSR